MGGYGWLQVVTGGYGWLRVVTIVYGLGVKESYWWLQVVTGGYWWIWIVKYVMSGYGGYVSRVSNRERVNQTEEQKRQ